MLYINESAWGWFVPACDPGTLLNVYMEFELYLNKENLIYMGF